MKIENKYNIKIILYFLFLLLVCSIIFFIFKMEISNEKLENNNVGIIADNAILPTPDRIIYKNKDNKYIIIDAGTNEYTQIYSELYNRTTNTINEKVYSEEQISEMQNRGSFIEFDYDTKSKNFVFMFEENEIGIIKRLSDSAQVIKNSLDDKSNLIKKIDNLTKDETRYDFDTEYSYVSENTLSKVAYDMPLSQTKVAGVYKKVIEHSENDYYEMLEKLNFKINQELPKVNFDRQSVVIIVSRYEIQKIKQSIGNIKYELGNFCDEYIVNVLIVSKVVNTNCIYYNTNLGESSVSQFTVNNNENGVEYFVENGKYYTNENHTKTEIISIETAADIADNEAKKQKYQYQGWKSEFYSRESPNDFIAGELILGLDDISKLYHWRNEWKNKEYENKIMWKIRLFDRNDPLTNLYIYIDAINGKVIGAGDSSD